MTRESPQSHNVDPTATQTLLTIGLLVAIVEEVLCVETQP